MRYLIVLQFIAILIVKPASLFGQAETPKWGTEIKYDGKEGSLVELISRSQDNMYLLEQKDFEPFKLKFFITSLDKDLNLVSSRELEAKSGKGREMKFMAAFHTQDRVILFSKMTEKIDHKNMNLVYASLFDLKGAMLGDAKIVDIREADKEYVFPAVCQSPDKSKYMVMSWGRKDEDGISSYNIHVLDASMNLLWGYNNISAPADKVYDFKGYTADGINTGFERFKKNIAVDNDGKAYLLMTVKRPKSKYLAVVSYYSDAKGKDANWDAAQNPGKEFALKADKPKLNYYDARLLTLNNGYVLLCFGYTFEESEDRGAYYMLIDGKAGNMVKQAFMYANNMQNTEKEAEGREKDTKLKFHFLYGCTLADGAMDLVFEANDDQPDHKKPNPGFLLAFKINRNAEEPWSKVIAASPGSSSFKVDKEGRLYISHTQLPGDLDKKELSALQSKGIGKDNDGILKLSILDKAGNLSTRYINQPNAAVVTELLPDTQEILYYRWVAYSMKYSVGLGRL